MLQHWKRMALENVKLKLLRLLSSNYDVLCDVFKLFVSKTNLVLLFKYIKCLAHVEI